MHAATPLALAVCIITLHRVASLSCAPCRPEQCQQRETHCKHGAVTDYCSCCVICGKGPGQRCGGPWDVTGRCGAGLVCRKRPRHQHPYAEFNAAGRCRPQSAERPLPRTDDVVFPGLEHVQQDEMERAARHAAGAVSLIESPLDGSSRARPPLTTEDQLEV